MRELDIRRALRKHLGFVFEEDPTALILEELGICRGTVRVDMAVVTGMLKGFEIKSDQDTLKRLPAQASAYNKVFDTLTIVAGTRDRAMRVRQTIHSSLVINEMLEGGLPIRSSGKAVAASTKERQRSS